MIFTFHSQAAGNLLMFRSDAENVLSLLGKDIRQSKGVISVDEMPAAIATLQAAIRQDQARPPAAPQPRAPQADGKDEAADQDTATEPERPVAFYQRAQPLLEMMQLSLREDKAITWGV
ncbi:DUF1840 domain-containing protein [Vogesella sp. GCM10023246]|uniref:DUF1840 domain-containing protein n=1 Tax=Vogesella oryzagri TaxID=3160864 RepID=A0ABV1M1Z2_9NEIS